MQSLARVAAASGARAAAAATAKVVSSAGPPRAASQTAARASSMVASMSAHRCLTAWNWPIGRPNWTRSRAWADAVATHQSPIPTASADRASAASSWPRPAGSARNDSEPTSTPSTSSVTTGRSRSRPRWDLIATSAVSRAAHPGVSPSVTGTSTVRMPSDQATGPMAPVSRRTGPSSVVGIASRPTAAVPGSEPSAIPGSSSSRWCSVPRASTIRPATMVGTTGPGVSARPRPSSTIARSASPYPSPPTSSGSARPSQPRSAISDHVSGGGVRPPSADSACSTASRRDSGGWCRSFQRRTVSARALRSSPNAIVTRASLPRRRPRRQSCGA